MPVEQPLSRVSVRRRWISRARCEKWRREGRSSGTRTTCCLWPSTQVASASLDLIALWPWTGLADLKDLLGVSRTRTYQVLDRPLRLGLDRPDQARRERQVRAGRQGHRIPRTQERPCGDLDGPAPLESLPQWAGVAALMAERQGLQDPPAGKAHRPHRRRTLLHGGHLPPGTLRDGRLPRRGGAAAPGRAHVSRLWRRVRLGQPRRIRAHRDGARRAPPLPGGGAQGRVERPLPRQAPAIPPLLRQRTAATDVRGMAAGAIRPPRRDRRDGPACG